MRPIVCRAIMLFSLLHQTAQASSQTARESPDGETTGAVLLVSSGLGLLVYYLYKPISSALAHANELADNRKNKFVLLEIGKANEYGTSYSAGAFLNSNQLLLGRLSQHLSPDRNINFKCGEFGYRHYISAWHAEIGLFNAIHHLSQNFYKLNNTSPEYRFDSYETRGGFVSIGASLMISQVSLGFRGTIHKGFFTQILQTYENQINPSDSSKQEARDQYKLRGTGYLELGFAM